MNSKTRIEPSELYRELVRNGVTYFCGVPDSLLSSFGHYVAGQAKSHQVAPNEGSAVGLAIGHYLATDQLAVVYMQNSGLGNALNPLLSLADPLVMGIPMLLVIGWRGRPGTKDEPQHTRQGLVTTNLLDAVAIPNAALSPDNYGPQIKQAVAAAIKDQRPYALLVTDEVITPAKTQPGHSSRSLSREEAIRHVLSQIQPSDLVIATTGKISRELYEIRKSQGVTHDLLVVGGMGHASSIALSVALNAPDRIVICFDGDGAVIMHMGALAMIGHVAPSNLFHIVLDNSAHDSVGGQPTASPRLDIAKVAGACGYRAIATADNATSLDFEMTRLQKDPGPKFLRILVRPGARSDLSRPDKSPREGAEAFMRHLLLN